MIRIFVTCMIYVLNDLLHMKVHIWNDRENVNECV